MISLPSLKSRFTQIINAPSISSTQPNLDQSNEMVIDLLSEWFSGQGFRCERQMVSAGKFNLIASIGHGEDGLVLSGHTDTVPCDEALWSQSPFELTEAHDRWYGLGVIDMKGFFPLILEALQKFDLQKIRHPLTIVATCDEESSMAGAQRLMELGKRLGRATVIGEPTGLKPIRAHKGIMMERLSIAGRSGHSSDPSLGHNALDAMSDCINALKQLRQDWISRYCHAAFEIPHPTLNLGCIHGGDNPNRICGHCALDFDVRTMPGMDAQTIRNMVRTTLTPICGRHNVTFSLDPIIHPLQSFEESSDAQILDFIHTMTGANPETVAFATEAPYFKALSKEVVVMGVGSIDVAHQPNEYLNLSDIKPAVHCLESLIHAYCFGEA
jgi:acetylornithine deacetylase